MECSLPGSFVHGILQARLLEWLPCLPPGDLPNLGIEPTSFMSPALAGRFFTTSLIWEVHTARENVFLIEFLVLHVCVYVCAVSQC